MDSEAYDTNSTLFVVGDVGRSPRMCYQANSLAYHGGFVNLVGYTDTVPHRKIMDQGIRLVSLPKPPVPSTSANLILRFFIRLVKMVWLLFALPYAFFFLCGGSNHRPLIMVQNPPGIPALFVCYLLAKIQFATFAIDWHNYSSSMFGNSWFSYLVGSVEGFFGRRASLNFCVSNAMKNDLKRRWGVNAITLYDRSPAWFSEEIDQNEKLRFFHKFETESLSELDNEWKFVQPVANDLFELREQRPLLVVSSTSWTPDEDFSILLDALVRLDKRMADSEKDDPKKEFPKIVVVITGKGPQKEFYEERIREISWGKVRVFTAWLIAEEYPIFLSCADLGVSLHTSTSGFDLPMKVVDLFGNGVPVLAKYFPAISELVDGNNGLLFDTPEELENLLAEVSLGFPDNSKLIELTKTVKEQAKKGNWHENWLAVVNPRLDKLL